MKSRIITGIIGIVLLIIILILPPIALFIALSAACALAMFELLSTTHATLDRGMLIVSISYSALMPFFIYFESLLPASIITLLYLIIMICLQIYRHNLYSIEQTSFVLLMSLIFPISFSSVAYLRVFNNRDGLFYVLLAIIIPWMSDIGAYFVGTLFGKHKLCPTISPKKTIEGLIGGIIVSVISAVIVGLIYKYFFLKDIATVVMWQVVLLALVCAPLSVIGDLFASMIKRQYHIKDFGNIMPGHGGIMDRFDSFLLVVPFIYLIVHYLPLVQIN